MTKFLHKSYSIQFNIKAQSPFFLDKQKVLWISPLLLFQVLLFSSSDLDVKFEEWWIWPSLLIKSIIAKSKVSSGIVKLNFDAFQESLFLNRFTRCFNASSFISKFNQCLRVFEKKYEYFPGKGMIAFQCNEQSRNCFAWRGTISDQTI